MTRNGPLQNVGFLIGVNLMFDSVSGNRTNNFCYHNVIFPVNNIFLHVWTVKPQYIAAAMISIDFEKVCLSMTNYLGIKNAIGAFIAV
jgi:hypothetical protein